MLYLLDSDAVVEGDHCGRRDVDLGEEAPQVILPRTATAFWEGALKTGRGGISTPQSGVFAEQRFGFGTRFGDEKGTNPEELIAAVGVEPPECAASASAILPTSAPHAHAPCSTLGAARSATMA